MTEKDKKAVLANHYRKQNVLRRARPAIVFLFVAGCVSGEFTYLTDRRFPPYPATQSIAVLDGFATKPHVRLGNVAAFTGILRSEQDCLDELKTQARAVGGDALIGYSHTIAPPGTVGAGKRECHAAVLRWD